MDHLSFFFQINFFQINCKELYSAEDKMTSDNLKMASEMDSALLEFTLSGRRRFINACKS